MICFNCEKEDLSVRYSRFFDNAVCNSCHHEKRLAKGWDLPEDENKVDAEFSKYIKGVNEQYELYEGGLSHRELGLSKQAFIAGIKLAANTELDLVQALIINTLELELQELKGAHL